MPAKKPTNNGKLNLNLDSQLNSFEKSFDKVTKAVQKDLGKLQNSTKDLGKSLEESRIRLSEISKESQKTGSILEKNFSNLTNKISGFSRTLDKSLRSEEFDSLILNTSKFRNLLKEVSDTNKKVRLKDTISNVGDLLSEFKNLGGIKLSPFFKSFSSFKEPISILKELQELQTQRSKAASSEERKAINLLVAAQKKNLELVSKSAMMYVTAASSISMSLRPMSELITYQDSVIRNISYINTGFKQSASYIKLITSSLIESRGLLEFDTGLRNFQTVVSEFREFVTPANKVLKTVNLLNAGIGYSADSAGRLAGRLKGIGVANYQKVFEKISNQIVYFAKNTDLTTHNIENLIDAADDLIYKFPKAIQSNLVPQILSIGAAFKSVHLDAREMISLLDQAVDVRNTQSMLRNALIAGREGLTFESLMEGQDLNKASSVLNSIIRENIKGYSGINAAVMSEVLSNLTGFSKKYIYRLRNMTDEEYQILDKRINDTKKISKLQDEALKSLNQQLESPLNSLRALGNSIKLILLRGASSMSFMLKPLKLFTDGLNLLLKPFVQFPKLTAVTGTSLTVLGLAIGVRLVTHLAAAALQTRIFTYSLIKMRRTMGLMSLGSFSKDVGVITKKVPIIGKVFKPLASVLTFLSPKFLFSKLGSTVSAGKSVVGKFFPKIFNWNTLSKGFSFFTKKGFISGITKFGFSFVKLGSIIGKLSNPVGWVITAVTTLWTCMNLFSKGKLNETVLKPFKLLWGLMKKVGRGVVDIFSPFKKLISFFYQGTKVLLTFTKIAAVKTVKKTFDVTILGFKLLWKGVVGVGKGIGFLLSPVTKLIMLVADLTSWFIKLSESGLKKAYIKIKAFTTLVVDSAIYVFKKIGDAIRMIPFIGSMFDEAIAENTKAVKESTAFEKKKLEKKDKSKPFELINMRREPLQQMNLGVMESALKIGERFGKDKSELDIIKKAVILNEQNRLQGKEFDDKLVDKLTSNTGSKARLGESIGQLTYKSVEDLGQNQYKIRLADDHEMIVDLFDVAHNAYKGISDILQKNGGKEVQTIEQVQSLNLSEIFKKLKDSEAYSLSVQINQLKDILNVKDRVSLKQEEKPTIVNVTKEESKAVSDNQIYSLPDRFKFLENSLKSIEDVKAEKEKFKSTINLRICF